MLEQLTHCPACGTLLPAKPVKQATLPGVGKLEGKASRRETRDASRTQAPGHGADPPARRADAAPLPEHVGRFEVRGYLGAGAFGAVYRAYDPQLDREVALKIPQSSVLANPRRVERFLREARAAARLRHPHIVPIYDAGRDGSQYFIASAFIAGQTLAETTDEPMAFARAARIARELAEALAHAHHQGVIHRDVKPANIMIDAEGHAHLMDFGLAHRHDLEDRLTKEGDVLGTPVYMAPEQAAGKSGEAQPATDQYSLGVVLYEMLCGEPPFTGPATVVLYNVLHQDPTPPRRLNPRVPVDLETIALKAMAKRPEDRYADCEALADDLRRWQEGEPIKARRLSARERLARWCKNEPRLALAASGVALSLLTAAIVAGISARYLSHSALMEARAHAAAEEALAKEEEAKGEALAKRQEALDAFEESKAARDKAEGLVQEINKQKQNLQEALDEIRSAKENADKARDEERRQRAAAEENLDRALDEQYLNLVSSVVQGSGKGRDAASNFATATLLDACPQQCRAWEWDYLRLQYTSTDGVQKNFEKRLGFPQASEPYQVKILTFSPTSRYLVAAINYLNPGHKPPAAILMKEVPDGVLRTFPYPAMIHRVAVSPNDKHLAACSEREEIQLYDVESEEKQFALPCPKDPAADVAFDRTGSALAAVSSRGKLTVWNLITHQSVFESKENAYFRVSYTGDGQRLILACRDQTVHVLDVPPGKGRSLVLPQRSPVADLAVSPDGSHLAVGCEDGRLRIWNLATGEQIREALVGHTRAIWAVSYSGDARRVATCSLDGSIRIWNAKTGRQVARFDTGLYPFLIAFSPNKRYLAWQGGRLRKDGRKLGREVELWDTARRHAEELSIGDFPNAITRLAFSPDGRSIAAGGQDGSVVLLDSSSGKRQNEWVHDDTGTAVRHLIFSQKGSRLIAASANRVRAWDVSQGKEILDRDIPGSDLRAVAISPNDESLALLASSRQAGNVAHVSEIVILECKPNAKPKRFRVDKAQLSPWLQFSGDGQLITMSSGGIVRWDVGSGKPVDAIPEQRGPSSVVSKDGTLIGNPQLTPSRLEIRDRAKATKVDSIPVPSWRSTELTVFSPDYSTVACQRRGGFTLWKLAESELNEQDHWDGHFGQVLDLAFSPDGERVATCAEDRTIKIWRVKPMR
jgi:WD40 repeat protein